MNSTACGSCDKNGPASPDGAIDSGRRSAAFRDLIVLGAISAALLILSIQVNFFERLWEFTRAHDDWELDEVFSLLMLLPFSMVLFLVRRWRELKAEVDHRITIQAELASAKTNAEAANCAKSVFLANMSHEIRTPLNAILGYSQLMLRDPALGASAKENLNIVSRSGQHLLGLINDILDMSKIEAGRMSLRPEPFDVSSLVEELKTIFDLRAETKGLAFETAFEGDAFRYITADECKIRQSLINLLGNAIKFTERGSVRLRVSVTERKDHQLWLAAEVEDTGVGISADEQNKLFQPFSQSLSGMRSQTGTGLGLAITRELARLMGGGVTFESTVGEGTTFHFEVPVRLAREDAAKAGNSARRVVGLETEQEPPRVLIVDDVSSNRDWLNQLLTSVGFVTREAENGEVGVHIWREWKPRVVLMDIRMPVMGGLEAIRIIKASPGGKETVIMALTASALDEETQEIMQYEIDGHFSKPVEGDRLLEAIQKALGLRYQYADDKPEAVVTPALRRHLTGDVLTDLPKELIGELRKAIVEGDKVRLDELIEGVRERSAESAGRLQELADAYEYDALTHLLEGVRQ